MASHHHHHHHHRHQQQQQQHSYSAACCGCCSCCCGCAGPQQSPPADPLVQALTARLLQVQAPQTYLCSHWLKPQTHQYQHQQQQKQQRFQQQEQQQTHSVLAALVRRIDALEASLRPFSSPSSYSPYSHPSYSFRDTAARTIQTHFRAFLVRRSRNLRHLKDLAYIKSSLNTLKSSVSDQSHLDYEDLSHKAMDLLLKLDSIQGGDPMIRDGKRSISRELVRFLEFIDGFSVKRHELFAKAVKSMRFAQNNRKSKVLMEKLNDPGKEIRGFFRVCENEEEDVELEGFHHVSDDEEKPSILVNGKHGFARVRNRALLRRPGLQSKMKKTVSFADDGELSRVLTSTHEPNSTGDVTSIDGRVCIDDHRELVENLCREVEESGGLSRGFEDDEEADMENGGFPQNSDDERNPRRNSRSGTNCEIRGHYQDHNGNFVFAAPLPVKMESRADLMNKRGSKESFMRGHNLG